MIFLYYLALYLSAAKLLADLDAWTEQSRRRTDLLAFLVLWLMMVVLSLVAQSPTPSPLWVISPLLTA